MKNLFTPVPDGRYELKCFALDEERSCVRRVSWHADRAGGPGEPTGNTVAADYVYALQFDGDRIRHMTKVWNDTISLQQSPTVSNS
jgi:hypothetical protein|tara:strand:- start:445 stop:702 length:258 start_codon:yes stop_codon:yes gene_type:complete